MANRLYNKQVSPKGYMGGGRVKKAGGGSLKMVMKGGKKVPFYAADGKGAKDLGRAEAKKRRKNSTTIKKIRHG